MAGAGLGVDRGIVEFKFFVGLFIMPLVVLAGLLLWWLLASRLRWSDRWLVVGDLRGSDRGHDALPTRVFADRRCCFMLCPPWSARGWDGWCSSFWLPWPVRRAGVLLIFIAVGSGLLLLRVDGMNGNFVGKFHWRWTPTPEQEFLAELKAKPAQPADVAVRTRRDPRTAGRLARFPRAATRRPIVGRADQDRLAAIAAAGIVAASHRPGLVVVRRDRRSALHAGTAGRRRVCRLLRRDERGGSVGPSRRDTILRVVGGPGPRATPTFHAGRLYTYGANGHLNCLDAASGRLLWSHDVAAEFKRLNRKAIPQWGFASSPLVAQGVVVVFAGARNGKTVVAYKEEKGELAWTASVGPALRKSGPELLLAPVGDRQRRGPDSACHQCRPFGLRAGQREGALASFLAGREAWRVSCSLRWSATATCSLGPAWEWHAANPRSAATGEEWLTEEQWTSRKIKPYFNDFVVLHDYLYGFDGSKFVCVSLKDGSETWRASGYGNGQVLLLADQELLLILSEEGDVALVSARPEKHEELCRFKAIEGKTWNHPVIAHGKLFVRNGEEIACFKLALLEEARETSGRITSACHPTTRSDKLRVATAMAVIHRMPALKSSPGVHAHAGNAERQFSLDYPGFCRRFMRACFPGWRSPTGKRPGGWALTWRTLSAAFPAAATPTARGPWTTTSICSWPISRT